MSKIPFVVTPLPREDFINTGQPATLTISYHTTLVHPATNNTPPSQLDTRLLYVKAAPAWPCALLLDPFLEILELPHTRDPRLDIQHNMSDPFDARKKRPPPILIPAVPRITATTQATRTNTNEQEQGKRQQQHQLSLSQQGSRFASSPLTSPLEHDVSRVPLPKSGSQKSRASAMTNLTNLIEEARQPTQQLELVGIGGSTRSKHSANSGQAGLGLHERAEKTTRAWIEARSEEHVFKIAGQIPPPHLVDAVGDDEVLVKTNDLRKECRAASEEQKGKSQGLVKSPKKKLFGMHLPNFGRSSAPNPPPMPSKAAQVLGHEPRNSKKAVRSGKSTASQETPTKAPRSDTSKSLPVKLLDQDKHARSHHTGATRRNRDISRRSPPRINKLPATAFNPFLGTEYSQASAPPPTPPAKDTPPEGRQPVQPASPLRRTAQLDGLREIYKADVDVAGGPLRFPAFALSPSPTKTFEAGFAGKSPSKQIPGTAEDYQKLIAGQPLPWPSPLRDDCNQVRVGDQPASAQGKVEDTQDTDSLYRDDRWSAEKKEHGDSRDAALSYRLSNPPNLPQPNEHSSSEYAPYVYSNHGSHHYSPLQPRFYSPSDRSVLKFADGETPSKNSDTTRFYCTVPSKGDPDSNNPSIEMVFQGDAHDIDPQSSTGRLVHNDHPEPMRVQMRDNSELAARVMQELRIGEQHGQPPHQGETNSRLQPDQSSSGLTDLLNGVVLGRDSYVDRFNPGCLSAVPSPLHKAPAPATPMQGIPPRQNSPVLVGSTYMPKNIEDHFYMTNEHLDVVGKSNWDQTETLKELHETSNHRHAQLITAVEQLVKEVKMQVDAINEKTDHTTEQGDSINNKLEQLFNFIRNDIMGVLAAQDKKATSVEQSIKELDKTVHSMQKMMEQKQSELKAVQQHTPVAAHATPNSPFLHRAQTSLAGFYGNMTESGREGPPGLPMPERTSSLAYDGHNDTRAGYGSNYGQQWGSRSNFPGRNGKEERPYLGNNPYQYAANGANGGQFGNGYNGNGYSPYSPAEQPYSFHQGPTK
ncbi:hypothetical protein HBI56_152870 [Parastagonospora nodorum]|nr:hypothetical protein HBH52_235870 [Parastagonospora nodorum]KAH4960771.1 hypothetical protein HBI78_152460 [Parastagonospora nodorum]KAH5013281.1 hypothetical protein HBI74_185730 [Parastagonospora nodorum]KAH5176460.1 hypothetical protein HBH77_199680 [Parastagonospora nodorum]KAH5498846.1 hypothetical protein HBI29_166310 [Parastagonospora nodorum]